MQASFSVVIPTRDRSTQVESLVTLVQNLRGAPDEVIVTDDASTDSTVDRLVALDQPVIVVRGSGSGPSAARNLGAGRSSGDWLIFLDDDDRPEPNWMVLFRHLAERHPGAAYLSINYLSSAGETIRARDRGAAFHHVRASFLAGTFAVRAPLFRSIGGFDERLRFGEFTDLAMNLFDRIHTDRLGIAHSDQAGLRIIERPAADRSSMRPDVFLESGRVAVEKNRRHWERDHPAYAGQLAVLGVAAMRAGLRSEGREYLLAARRLQPRSLRHGARYVACSTPGFRRLVWRQ